MNQIRKFMYGRYGFDQFGRTLIYMSLFMSVLSMLTKYNAFYLLSYLPFAYGFFRILSKNIPKRTLENMRYCKIITMFRNKIQNIILAVTGTKTHKYFKCVHCKQTIRVPKGKGKICITCPKCKAEFVRRT